MEGKAVENAESALRVKEIIGTVANGKAGLGLHPQRWWSKAVYDVLPTPVNLHAWGLTTSDRCRACGKTASLKHILTGCEYALRSYTWRHNEVLEIFSEVSKKCCETANKSLNIINRAIQFVKEENISKIARENMRKPSLLEACTDWYVETDLKYNFIFATEIALTTKRPDIVIWSVKTKKSFRYRVNGPLWRKFRLGTSA